MVPSPFFQSIARAATNTTPIQASSASLKDQLFCVTEERDYFQAKFLEQVSEISALTTSLKQAKAEIQRLRHHVMAVNTASSSSKHSYHSSKSVEGNDVHRVAGEEKKENEDEEYGLQNCYRERADDESSLSESSYAESHNDGSFQSSKTPTSNNEEDINTAEVDIRQNAAQLLQWADYRRNDPSPLKAATSSNSSIQDDDKSEAHSEPPDEASDRIEIVQDENDEDDSQIKAHYQVYCERIKQLQEEEELRKNIDRHDTQNTEQNRRDTRALLEEAHSLLEQMAAESDRLRPKSDRKDEWVQRIFLYKSQLRLLQLQFEKPL